jgi:hypothetical protein
MISLNNTLEIDKNDINSILRRGLLSQNIGKHKYAIQDLEFSKENLIKNPKLYQDGLVGALFNSKLFLQWILSSAIYAFLLFCISFKGMFSSL